MATLGTQSIASSYEQLLHVDRDGGGNGTTLVNVKDGDNGTTFALQLASDNIKVDGTTDLDGQVTINESGADKDFRVEASGETNALFVQGSDGFVGIGNASPGYELDVHSTGNQNINIESDDEHAIIKIDCHTAKQARIDFREAGSTIFCLGLDGDDDNKFKLSNGSDISSGEWVTVDTSGNVGIGTTCPSR